jgi:hypothetical protein
LAYSRWHLPVIYRPQLDVYGLVAPQTVNERDEESMQARYFRDNIRPA